MYSVLGYLDGKKVFKANMPHIPRVGESVSLGGGAIGTVTYILWGMSLLDYETKNTHEQIKQPIFLHMKGE